MSTSSRNERTEKAASRGAASVPWVTLWIFCTALLKLSGHDFSWHVVFIPIYLVAGLVVLFFLILILARS